MSNCDFVTFPCGILGPVWYLIVLILDLCLLFYFIIVHFWAFDSLPLTLWSIMPFFIECVYCKNTTVCKRMSLKRWGCKVPQNFFFFYMLNSTNRIFNPYFLSVRVQCEKPFCGLFEGWTNYLVISMDNPSLRQFEGLLAVIICLCLCLTVMFFLCLSWAKIVFTFL